MPGLTPRDIILSLRGAGMNSDSLWVEYSLGLFDYKKIHALTPPDLVDVLPLRRNVFSSLTLWRILLPRLFSHQLSHLFTLVCPNENALASKRHKALPDAIMSVALLKVAVKIFESSNNE